jgi:hypothetical protein
MSVEIAVVSAVVGAAAAYLGWVFWRSVRPKGGCAACHVRPPVAQSDEPPRA